MKKTYWKCPKCGRRFSKSKQTHSCVKLTLDYHFRKKPKLKKLFSSLVRRTKKFGPVRVEVVKSAINLGAKYHFAMIYVRKNGFQVEFGLREKIKSKRFLHTRKMGYFYIYYVKVSKKEDIDTELLDWLKQSYKLNKN